MGEGAPRHRRTDSPETRPRAEGVRTGPVPIPGQSLSLLGCPGATAGIGPARPGSPRASGFDSGAAKMPTLRFMNF